MSLEIKAIYRDLLLQPSASAEEVRAAYLSLVQKYPPDREPEHFSRINRAYQLLSDPLKLANELADEPDESPNLVELVERLAAEPRRLTPDQLLSLGNREG